MKLHNLILLGFSMLSLVACDAPSDTDDINDEVAVEDVEEDKHQIIEADSIENTVLNVASYLEEDVPEAEKIDFDNEIVDSYKFADGTQVISTSDDGVRAVVFISFNQDQSEELFNLFEIPMTSEAISVLESDEPFQVYETTYNDFGLRFSTTIGNFDGENQVVHAFAVSPL